MGYRPAHPHLTQQEIIMMAMQIPYRPYTQCWLLPALCLLLLTTPSAHAQDTPDETLVAQLLSHYRQITSVSCDVRRDVVTPEGTMRWLSRVYFKYPNRLHAANAAPLPRLIIADGTTMFQHTSGQSRGFRRPLGDLDETMRVNLQRVPGTLMEHLVRLQHAPEEVLEPTPDAAIRRAYTTEQVYVILEADDQYRLKRMQFHAASDQGRRTAEITCDGFEEVIPDVWIAMRHESIVHIGEHTVRERIRFSDYEANIPLPEDIFRADKHYADEIEWVESFDQL